MKKKITIFVLHLNFGGVEKYVSSLCKMLMDNYDIKIISTYKNSNGPAFFFDSKIKIDYLLNTMPKKGELKEAICSKNIIKIIKFCYANIKILFLKYFKNIEAIKKENCDFIISTRTFHNKLISKYAKNNIIKISTEHNFHNNNSKYINGLVRSLKNFDCLVCVSKELQKFYKDKLPNLLCVYIPNVIDEMPIKTSDLKHNALINVGRLEPEKGQIDLLYVFKEVLQKKPNCILYLIGDGSLKDLIIQKTKELGIEKNVVITGFLKQKEIEEYMLKSKMFVMTSLTESFGLVLIEAMSYGLPCLAFDCASGARQVLENGILIPNRDIQIMSNNIIKLLDNNKVLKDKGSVARGIAIKYCSLEIKKEWLKLLNKLNISYVDK